MSTPAARLDTLAARLADPDADLDQIAEVEEELMAARDTSLIPELEEHLTGAVEARNWYGRHVLARILAATAGSGSLPALLRAFAHDLGDDQDSLAATVTTLARQDPRSARSIVLPWVSGTDPDLCRAALWLLGFVPEPGDLDLLARAIQDADDRVRRVVVGTIGSHTKTSARAVDMLTALLADPSPQVRVNALSSLGFARQPRTLAVIHRLAQDNSAQVRAWVAIALGRFPAPGAASQAVLDSLANDTDAFVREQAASALKRLTDNA